MIHFNFIPPFRFCYLRYDSQEEFNFLKNNVANVFNPIDPICRLKTYKGPTFRQVFFYEYAQKNVFYFSFGLAISIYKYIKQSDFEIDGFDINIYKNSLKHSYDDFKKIVSDWNLNINPREYQLEAAYNVLCWKTSISSISTRAGKTLIAYLIFRYAMQYLGSKKILMIVPSIDLVKQGFSDFSEYAEFFKTEAIWSGGKVVESSNLTIATFQSLINYLNPESKRYNPRFFDNYDLLFVDETHRANAKSIKTIIEAAFMKNLILKFGMTGTLPEEYTLERYCISTLLGPKIQDISPKELMDAGYLSKVDITQIRIKYNRDIENEWVRCAKYSLGKFVTDENGKHIKLDNPEMLIAYKKQFSEKILNANIDELKNEIRNSTSSNLLRVELMLVHFMHERINLLIKVIKKYCHRNTLILCQHIEYIKYVGEILKKEFPNRPVCIVHGSSKDRRNMKDIFSNNDNVIMIANYAVVGTGITLSNLCHGVLFESFKSKTINVQAIGRGLALASGKNVYQLFDFVDCFDKHLSNSLKLQGMERIKIYKQMRYPCKVANISL